ncbi:MAG: nucleotidyltransferase family protein [Dehalococcoidales bacterium]
MKIRQDSSAFVSAILLAAGESKRMGSPKLLLPFAGGTILGRTIDNLLASSVAEVIVVLGAGAQKMKKAIAARAVRVVFNPDYRLGMATSLKAGLGLVDGRAQRVMVALADQPIVDRETYDRLIEESLASGKGIIIPTYQASRGNPIIFSIGYKGELLGLKGDVGGREIVVRHPDDILEVAVGSKGVSIDIDTMADYYSRPGLAG